VGDFPPDAKFKFHLSCFFILLSRCQLIAIYFEGMVSYPFFGNYFLFPS